MSQKEIAAYILQLSPMEKQILNIAKTHLETSFSLVKSIGFQEWQAEQAQAQAQVQAEQAQAQAEQAQAQAEQTQAQAEQAASMPPAPPSSKT